MHDVALIDLCAGTGAFSLAFDVPGCRCVFANDMEKASESAFNINHNGVRLTLADLHTISEEDIPPHDILCAGFSCQPFRL